MVGRELDIVDMEVADVDETLVRRLRDLIHGCKKGDKDDKLLDIVFGMWRRGK